MLNTRSIHIHINWLDDGHFFLRATDRQNRTISRGVWVKQLFLAHEESYFGSRMQSMTHQGYEGIVLSSWQWVTLFKSEQFNRFIHWEWDELGHFSLAAAPVLYDAVTEGGFLPNFNEEGLTWTVPDSVWDEFSPSFWEEIHVPHMTNRELVDRIFQKSTEEAFREAGKNHLSAERLEAITGGALTSEELNSYFDEGRWREWMGMEESEAPFSIGLRLTEPELDGDEWQLETILIKKKDPEKIVHLNGRHPKSWAPFLHEAKEEEQRWLRLFPWLGENELHTHLSEEQAFLFLTEASEKLMTLGVKILLPSWWESVRKTKLSLTAKVASQGSSHRPSFVGLQAILDFNWRLSMNGADFSEKEFEQLASENRRLVKVNGEWIQLDPEMIRKIQTFMEKAKKEGLRIQDLLEQELMPDEEEESDDWNDARMFAQVQIDLNRSFRKMITQLKDVSTIPLMPASDSLQGELRPYQQLGFSWLAFLRSCGFGAILADDMGLGKTIQLISYLLHVKEKEQPETAALIICPTSVLGNWQKELERFAPDLRVALHYGSSRAQGDDFKKIAEQSDVILTSYGLSHLDFDTLSEINWSSIALDEAQNIKNAHTKQSKAIRKLKGAHHIALTGTPMENRLSELWAIFDFTNHGYLNTLPQFQKNFIVPIEKDQETAKIEHLQAKIRPFLLRRTKTDPEVELNLPDKLEQKEYCPLTAEQAVLYEQLVKDTMDEISRLSAFERRGLILQMLNKIKQLCNHPALYLKEQQPVHVLERSQKMNKLTELIENIVARQEGCLIFTQYIGMGEMIQSHLSKHFGLSVPFLNGSTTKEQRDEFVKRFQDGEFPVFLLSLKAGGTGLNLTAANHVIHFDRWWNPAVENQATDRAYRIGQNRFVHVHKMITTGTLEEKIDAMLEKKQALNDEIIKSDQWITELSDHELEDLLKLG
ncbi:SNF2 family DNA or RNA helicase [Bacillus ectoiniformans]|uniref:DEAD/DEAH box helicase n=1 Tax=Bacillus ectoiniformans TaxID=1494429 RepID=UPI00195E8866|nr:DEAD/DEAH box helicase [Bacillus ectoiniformans]MBM7648385.1 SNF2 family DNA or RNA helicase [Bacillus ectoiniformans]